MLRRAAAVLGQHKRRLESSGAVQQVVHRIYAPQESIHTSASSASSARSKFSRRLNLGQHHCASSPAKSSAKGSMQFLVPVEEALQNAIPQLQTRGLIYVPSPGDAKVQTVTLIPGDGIGPEISNAVEKVVDSLKAPIEWERFDDLHGSDSRGHPVEDVPAHILESIKKNGVCMKGTLFTPLSGSNTSTQSLNVQLRKQLDLHVNLVHGFSIPGVKTRHEGIDIVVIRENTEGEYSGLEHEVVPDVVESLKVITSEKSRRVAEYAFGFAYLNNRKKVTAVHKANIMKLSDGAFLKEFRDVAKQYPTIKADEMIVDNTCMQLTGRPDQFDVMITPNLYGNIVANVVAGLTGGPGIMPGANVGNHVAVFEQGARHVGQDIAGQNIANPTAALLSTAMLLRHCNLPDFADRIQKAILEVINGNSLSVKTPDIGGTGTTTGFTDAVISRL